MAFLLRKQRVLCSAVPIPLIRTLHKSTTDEVEVAPDALAEFTDELMSKRQLRWEILRQKRDKHRDENRFKDFTNFVQSVKRTAEKSVVSVSEVMFLSVDFEKLDEKHIDHLVVMACRDKNIEFIDKFVDECVADNRVIGEDTVLTICEYCSTLNDNKTLLKLIELCKLNNKLVYDLNCEFRHYVARSLWGRGNSDGALTLLDKAYEGGNTTVRTSIRSIFQFVVDDTVENKSEAVLVRLIKSAKFLQARLNEPTVLLYIWKVCFLSSWFSDQVMADRLFSDYSEIRIDAARRRGILSYNALCSGQVDIVHRLIQAFLKFNMKDECKLCLELLFEYQYASKNLRACSEIFKTTLELDIKLSDTYNKKLINLLVGGTDIVAKPKKHVIQKIDFKF